MTAVANGTRPLVGAEPRVELLPPEVALRERARTLRRRLLIALCLVLVVVVCGYALAWFQVRTAENRLAQAQARTVQLLSEQAQYQEVTQVLNLLAAGREVQVVGTSAEVLWRPTIDEIRALLPEGATLDAATASGRMPWEPELAVAGPLRSPRVATLSLVVLTDAVPDAAELARSLGAVTGFVDASPDTVVSGDGGYTVGITLNLGEEALALRYAADVTADGGADGTDDGAEDGS